MWSAVWEAQGMREGAGRAARWGLIENGTTGGGLSAPLKLHLEKKIQQAER